MKTLDTAVLYDMRTAKMTDEIDSLARLTAGCGSILEVGAGTGRVLAALPDSVRKVGVEIDPRFLARARTKLDGRANVFLIQGDFLTLALPGPFDAVLFPFNGLAEFIEVDDRIAALGRAAELLAESGRIIIVLAAHDFGAWARSEASWDFDLAAPDPDGRRWHAHIRCQRESLAQRSRCEIVYTCIDDAEMPAVHQRYVNALITRNELLATYRAARLHLIEEYGSLRLESLTPASTDLIHVLAKTGRS